MKPLAFLVLPAALMAVASCHSKQSETGSSPPPAKVVPVKAPQGGDWTTIVSETAAGGMLMGNPNASVKLIEYGSLTCPHCREFDEKSVPVLLANYVKSGRVSWEFRNYVRDEFDLTASLIARCNGAKDFFPLARALYKDQPAWVGRIQKTPQARLEAIQAMQPSQQFLEAAKITGLQDWVAARGVPPAKSTQCLTNMGGINQLVQMTSDATTQFPDFKGTPTFVVNGKMVDGATWDELEPALKKALGG